MKEPANSYHQLVARIAAAYNVPAQQIHPAQKGYRNSSFAVDDIYNIILYKREPGMAARIARANAVGNFAAQHGLPARHTADPRILQLGGGEQTRFAAIYTYLPGQTIPWEAYGMEHIKNLGGMLSSLHAVLATMPPRALPDVASESIQLNDRMLRYFADTAVLEAMAQKLRLGVPSADFRQFLRHCRKLPGQQPLHMDFVRGNILFEGTTITGILDFEKTAYGHPLFDIARTLAFLLVDCKYKPEEKVRKYFFSGYQKRGPARLQTIRINNQDTLEMLVDFFLLHDFYKFLRHNPYESLAQNEHFMRTKTMLLKRRRIRTVR